MMRACRTRYLAQSGMVKWVIAALAVLSTGAPGQTLPAARVTLREARVPLRHVVDQIQCDGLCRVDVAPEIRDDPVTVFVRARRPSEVLRALATVMQYRLRLVGPDHYSLSLDPGWASVIAALDRREDAAEQFDEQEKAAVLQQSLDRVLGVAAGGEGNSYWRRQADAHKDLLGVVASLSPEQRAALTAGAAEPLGVIAAGPGNAHMGGRVQFVGPLGSVSPAVAAAIRASAMDQPALQRALDQDGASVGIGMQDGALGFTLFAAGRYVIGPGLPLGDDALLASQARAEAARRHREQQLITIERADRLWLDPLVQPLPPAATRTWPPRPVVRTPTPTEPQTWRTDEDSAFAWLASRGGLELVSDAWTFPLISPIGGWPALSGPSAAPASVWAQRLAAAHQRLYRVADGLLLLRANRPLWSRHVQVPRAVLEALRGAQRRQGRLEFGDYLRHAAVITEERARVLNVEPAEDGIHFRAESILFRNERRLLAFIARHSRQSASGTQSSSIPRPDAGEVSLTRVDLATRHRFRRFLWTAVPVQADRRNQAPRIRWSTERDGVNVEFDDPVLQRASRRLIPIRPRVTAR